MEQNIYLIEIIGFILGAVLKCRELNRDSGAQLFAMQSFYGFRCHKKAFDR